MNITKLGHCAMILNIEGKKFLTDPGSFTVEAQNAQTGLTAVIITHEHQDHFHVESLKVILANNPGCVVVTNSAVAALIAKENLNATVHVVGDGQSIDIEGVLIEGMGRTHAVIWGDMGQCENTAYFVANKFYFPGDNFHAPGKPVDVLALPVAGPWMKVGEAIDFALLLKPRIAFGVHDGMMKPTANFGSMMAQNVLGPAGIEYVALKDSESREF